MPPSPLDPEEERVVSVGDKAAELEVEIPSPLWIFCYGSLCWRPEASFAGCENFAGEVVGWKRLFAQKSTDHRGTPENPGLVATLVSDADLDALGVRQGDDPPSRTHGVAYRVPPSRVEEVLAGLDVRESGGYERVVVKVFKAGEACTRNDQAGVGVSDPQGETPLPESVEALLYTASTINPNFSLGSTAEAAAVIARATGQSGPNHEYLLRLWEFLWKVGCPDPHVDELAALVRRHLGM